MRHPFPSCHSKAFFFFKSHLFFLPYPFLEWASRAHQIMIQVCCSMSPPYFLTQGAFVLALSLDRTDFPSCISTCPVTINPSSWAQVSFPMKSSVIFTRKNSLDLSWPTLLISFLTLRILATLAFPEPIMKHDILTTCFVILSSNENGN